MRIIAGDLKGRKLTYIKSDILRPTKAIVRKSVMDSIRDFDGKIILDLFSGVGTLGIEAMSRGAKEVIFVEKNYKVINILKKNIEKCNLLDFSTIVKSDVIPYLEKNHRMYDIIFADPPYRSYKFEEIFSKVSCLLNDNGIFCYESNRENVNINQNVKIKHYGNTQIILWENK
tara:strand:+ start:44332 stop:44850 length:519 start_codon:yes stop_codon:yes gene_type:complete